WKRADQKVVAATFNRTLRCSGIDRSSTDKTSHYQDPRGEHDEIDHDISGQRNQDICGRQGRRYRICSAEQAIYGPWLTPHLGGNPAGQHGDKAERGHKLACPQEPARFDETSLKPQPPTRHDEAEHNNADSDHDAEGEEWDRYRRAISWRP